MNPNRRTARASTCDPSNDSINGSRPKAIFAMSSDFICWGKKCSAIFGGQSQWKNTKCSSGRIVEGCEMSRRIRPLKSPARDRCRGVLERVEEFLAKEQNESNAELIRQLRAAYFADVDALEKSGKVKIPR